MTTKETTKETALKTQVRDFLDTLELDYQENVQKLNPESFEAYDFWISEYNLAIDVNDYTHHQHSNPPINEHLLSSSGYHKNKVLESQKKGIKLMLLWQNWLEDEQQWKVLQNIVHHELGLHTQKIYARKCTVEWADRNSQEVKDFYNKNALFKHHGGTHCAVLRFENEIVMAMTNRYKKDSASLLCERMAAKSGYSIPGGMSKIIKFIERNVDFKSWEFFIVLDYGKGFGLEKCGFTPTKTQATLMQYQVADDIALSRGRGSYQEFKQNIEDGIEARIYYAGTRKYIKEKSLV